MVAAAGVVTIAVAEKGTQTPNGSPDNRSLRRGLELLRAFRPGSEYLGNGELAERCALSRATVSRLTQTLLRAGFLEYHPATRRYSLGAPVLSLASARRSGSRVLQCAADVMRMKSESARVNVGIALADRDDMVYLEAYHYQRRAAMRTIATGQRVPMELTALGRAWLAANPAARPALYQRFAQRRAQWPKLRRAIEAAIADVARQGWCWASWKPEIIALATPLVLPGELVHVLHVSSSSDQDAATQLPQLAAHLLEIAATILTRYALQEA